MDDPVYLSPNSYIEVYWFGLLLEDSGRKKYFLIQNGELRRVSCNTFYNFQKDDVNLEETSACY